MERLAVDLKISASKSEAVALWSCCWHLYRAVGGEERVEPPGKALDLPSLTHIDGLWVVTKRTRSRIEAVFPESGAWLSLVNRVRSSK